jgi:hypothetical protein
MIPGPVPRHRLDDLRTRLAVYAYELTEPEDGDEFGIHPGRPAILTDQALDDLQDIVDDYRRRHHYRQVDTIATAKT